MDDLQHVVNSVIAVLFSLVGWFAREIWSAVKELKNDLAKLREELPREFVMREDYRSDLKDIKEMLSKIVDKLDHKADK
jgi:hypothetical protein